MIFSFFSGNKKFKNIDVFVIIKMLDHMIRVWVL